MQVRPFQDCPLLVLSCNMVPNACHVLAFAIDKPSI
jgi:hypothetical protein